jgi:hypothetical protein
MTRKVDLVEDLTVAWRSELTIMTLSAKGKGKQDGIARLHFGDF